MLLLLMADMVLKWLRANFLSAVHPLSTYYSPSIGLCPEAGTINKGDWVTGSQKRRQFICSIKGQVVVKSVPSDEMAWRSF